MLLLARVLIAVFIVVPFWYWDGGLLEYEATEFIRQYLAGRGFLQTIFDPYANDLDTYQARELSYVFDYLDARVFRLIIERGHALFVPLSAVIASLLTVVIFLRGLRRYPSVPPLTATLVLLLYLSNYVYLVTMGMFYRSSKPMLAPLLMATSFYVLGLIGSSETPDEPGRRSSAALVVFVLLCGMSLLDRQGFFYALMATAVLASSVVFAGGRRNLLVAAVAAVAAMSLYNVVLAPALVESLNGYVPSLEYQKLPAAGFAEPVNFLRAGELLVEATALLMADVPGWLAVGALGVLVAGAFSKGRATSGVVVGGGIVIVAHLFMFAAMVIRHPAIYDQYDHRVWYYPLPFQALLVSLGIVLLSRSVAPTTGWRTAIVNVLLVAGVIGNVAQWSDHVRLQRRSRWFSIVYTQTFLLKRSLETGLPHSEYDGYGPFYRYCLTISPPFRAVAERARTGN